MTDNDPCPRCGRPAGEHWIEHVAEVCGLCCERKEPCRCDECVADTELIGTTICKDCCARLQNDSARRE